MGNLFALINLALEHRSSYAVSKTAPPSTSPKSRSSAESQQHPNSDLPTGPQVISPQESGIEILPDNSRPFPTPPMSGALARHPEAPGHEEEESEDDVEKEAFRKLQHYAEFQDSHASQPKITVREEPYLPDLSRASGDRPFKFDLFAPKAASTHPLSQSPRSEPSSSPPPSSASHDTPRTLQDSDFSVRDAEFEYETRHKSSSREGFMSVHGTRMDPEDSVGNTEEEERQMRARTVTMKREEQIAGWEGGKIGIREGVALAFELLRERKKAQFGGRGRGVDVLKYAERKWRGKGSVVERRRGSFCVPTL